MCVWPGLVLCWVLLLIVDGVGYDAVDLSLDRWIGGLGLFVRSLLADFLGWHLWMGLLFVVCCCTYACFEIYYTSPRLLLVLVLFVCVRPM